MSTKKLPLAFVVEVVKRYDQVYLHGTVVEVQDDGSFRNLSYSYGSENGAEYADFVVRAYVDRATFDGTETLGVWGLGYGYQDVHSITSADHAKAIGRVLSTVDRGLSKLNESLGNLRTDSDYGAYLFRIANVLKIGKVYVRNPIRRAAMTGDKYRIVNATDLQYHVASVVDDVHNGRISEYVRN